MRDRGFLPSETSEYVPKVLAAMEVATSPKRSGIDVVKTSVHRLTQFADALRFVREFTCAEVDRDQELNPALKRGVVPPDGYEVRRRKAPRPVHRRARLLSRARADALRGAVARHHGAPRRCVGRIASRYGCRCSAGARLASAAAACATASSCRSRADGSVRLAADDDDERRPVAALGAARAQRTAQEARRRPGSARDATARRSSTGKTSVSSPTRSRSKVAAAQAPRRRYN
jgi:hypothetical protein